MESGQRPMRYVLKERQVKTVEMEVENVEIFSLLLDLRQHGEEVSRNVPREFLV
jgi:hypothetical protein